MTGDRKLKRRELLAAVGGIAIFAPLTARGQQRKAPLIGVLVPANPDTFRIPFEEGLRDLGYVAGRTIELDFRSADGSPDRLARLAAELVQRKVDILVGFQTPAVHALKEATRDIPIVMSAGDPVGTGVVASLARPGANITGFSSTTAEIGEKTIELMRELIPSLRRVAVLANVSDPFTGPFLDQIGLGAKSFDVSLRPVKVRAVSEFAQAFAEFTGWRADAVIVQPSLPRTPALDLARKYRLPAVSAIRQFAVEGGLMSFAANFRMIYSSLASYVDKILKGAKPGDLPVQQPTRFELVLNLKTAKALGIDVPTSLLARADEVIE
jgi:putative ABC transport system substrate-binding protein